MNTIEGIQVYQVVKKNHEILSAIVKNFLQSSFGIIQVGVQNSSSRAQAKMKEWSFVILYLISELLKVFETKLPTGCTGT